MEAYWNIQPLKKTNYSYQYHDINDKLQKNQSIQKSMLMFFHITANYLSFDLSHEIYFIRIPIVVTVQYISQW